MKKRLRNRRKNFLPTLILIVVFWAIFGFLVFFVEPEQVKDFILPNSYLPFFANLFLALFFTLSIVFGNSRRGLLVSLSIILFFILRLNSLGNFLNLFLIAGFTIALNLLFTTRF